MENFSGEMEKNLMPKDLHAQNKRSRKWQLLFVDDHGKMISFTWLKSAAIFVALTLFISIACSILFVVLFQKNRQENVILKQRLEESGERIKNLRNEMDILLAKLVLTESKIEPVLHNDSISESKPTVPMENSKPALVTRTKRVAQNAKKKPKDPIVSHVQELEILDFKISNKSSSRNTLKISFMIKNKDQKIKTATGYIFVVLKQTEQDHAGWFAIPSVALKGGSPVDIKRGQFFRISRFKTVYFRANTSISPDLFTKAAVFVFDKKGDRIFEKSFPVTIQTVHSDDKQANTEKTGSMHTFSELTRPIIEKKNSEIKQQNDDIQRKSNEIKKTESVFVKQADETGKMPINTN